MRYAWHANVAELFKTPGASPQSPTYPNKLVELYTQDGYLHIKSDRWAPLKYGGAMHETHTLINLSQVVYINVFEGDNDMVRLRIGLAKME